MVDSRRFNVDICIASVGSRRDARIALDAIVEKALAGQIMVETDDVGLARAGGELRQIRFRRRFVA